MGRMEEKTIAVKRTTEDMRVSDIRRIWPFLEEMASFYTE
jgi:hypothetical protein